MTANRIVNTCYFAAPLFLILEFSFVFDLRVSSFIGDTAWRVLYYLFCFGCAGIIFWRFAFTIGPRTVASIAGPGGFRGVNGSSRDPRRYEKGIYRGEWTYEGDSFQ